jgi:hypothetical protein
MKSLAHKSNGRDNQKEKKEEKRYLKILFSRRYDVKLIVHGGV